jgi:hypothetical protein
LPRGRVCQDAAVTTIYSAVFSAVCAAAISVAAYEDGGWLVVGAAAGCVLFLAVGWGDVLHLPHRLGTGLLVLILGGVALLVSYQPATPDRPLAVFPALLAAAVLLAFGHELLRRDGRKDLVESVTGTLTGQVVAVLTAGWVLLVQTDPGWNAVLVAAAALVAARLIGALPLPVAPAVMAWAGIGCGLAAALVASVFVTGLPALTAMALGAAVAGVGVAFDRLLVDPRKGASLLAVLAGAAAPVAAAGSVAYAIVQVALT